MGPKHCTIADLFIEAMADAGLKSVGADKGYVSTIYAPEALGGYALSEFTNGKFSGWMYAMNGKHTRRSLQYPIENDKKEEKVGSGFGAGTGPHKGERSA